uniref:Uncharacterized protein n=1 Tax=Eutreptiella gymnastica TaxID=73025 RepID=A0A7S4FVV5_9EUGL
MGRWSVAPPPEVMRRRNALAHMVHFRGPISPLPLHSVLLQLAILALSGTIHRYICSFERGWTLHLLSAVTQRYREIGQAEALGGCSESLGTVLSPGFVLRGLVQWRGG